MSSSAPAAMPSLDDLIATLGAMPPAYGALAAEVRNLTAAFLGALPKIPKYDIITLQTGQWWRAQKNDYLHLRMLAVHAITVSADTPIGIAVPFLLAAATVTEFFLPEGSELTVSAGGTGPGGSEPVLMMWDDIS